MPDTARKILKEVFGYNEFKPLQAEIIQNILEKNDTLVIMPTGGGKSLCYQIPALIFDGLTVVISPLISLMKDQVEQLAALNAPAVFLNSTLSQEAYSRNVNRVRSGQAKLLYVAPETLFTTRTQALLAMLQVDCLTIDEAHCISEWGHDFRPEYRKLVDVRKKFPNAVCVALTATATPQVQEDIKQNLGFKDAGHFLASFNRENLFIRVVPKINPVDQAIEFLREFPEKSGIIYCFSRRQVENLAETLASSGFSVRPYHAGLPDIERKQNQELFIRDNIQIIVATVAFGMGINKPNVRFVLHYDLPKNIEGYYQEIGRAGRDGLRAECMLLFGYGDISKIRFIISQKEEQEQRLATKLLNAILRYAETDACRRKNFLTYFGETYEKANCGMCDNCLSLNRQQTDITVPAQMFLSCVKRTGERFGANHIIDVLRGSKSQRVLNFRHSQLSTYGIGKDYTKKQWFHLSRQFLQKGLLKQDPEFGGLLLSDKAAGVLRDGEKVSGKIEEDLGKIQVSKAELKDYDVELFQVLKKKRKHLADQADVPPYVIFSDRSLIEMASCFPQSNASLLQIHGVGQAKLDKYGKGFLSSISGYCHRKGIKENMPKPAVARSVQNPAAATPRSTQAAELLNQGRSLQEIMKIMNVQEPTVIDYLGRYVLNGNTISAEMKQMLLKQSKLPENIQRKAFDAFVRLGTERLKPVFLDLTETASYDELKILRLVFLSENRPEETKKNPGT